MLEIKEENITRFIYAMFNLMQGMKQGVEDCCMRCGNLNEKELMIINYVGLMQNAKMSDIAENMTAPLSTLTSIVDKLVDRNYLTRYHSNEDRRVVLVTLASHGKDTYKSFMNDKVNMSKQVLSHYSLKDQESLIKNLELLPNIMYKKK